MFAMPPATQALIIVNVLVFMLQQLMGAQFPDGFALWTFGPGSRFQPWQLVTYGFLHGGFAHLFFNMLALFMFGSDIERLWGPRRYLVYYFACVVSAALAQIAVSMLMGWGAYQTIGASGGVFGVLLAFGMMFPRRMVMLLFPPIPMRAWVLVLVYGALELFMGITGTQTGVAHFAHLGGMAGGFLLIQYWRGRLPIRPSRR
jgi:membrane associated rhomboid family serine protease